MSSGNRGQIVLVVVLFVLLTLLVLMQDDQNMLSSWTAAASTGQVPASQPEEKAPREHIYKDKMLGKLSSAAAEYIGADEEEPETQQARLSELREQAQSFQISEKVRAPMARKGPFLKRIVLDGVPTLLHHTSSRSWSIP